jgi:branched-chain amino acid transport system permease protein
MKKIPIIIIILVSISLAFLPSIIDSSSTLTILCTVLLYISLATSWNILGGYAGQISLGHSAFFGLGALATRMLWFSGVPLIISMLSGCILATLFALLIGFPAFKLKGAYFTIGTLALGQALFATIGNIFPTISTLPPDSLTNYNLSHRYFMFLGVAFISIIASYVMATSSFGLGMKAVREEEDAAESLGVNAFKHKLFALIVSAFLSGLAGGAFAYYFNSYYPQYPFSPIWSLDSSMMAFIGGTGTIVGPVIGAIFFVVLKTFLSLRLPEFHLTVFGTLFILVVLFLPGGLVGIWKAFQKVIQKNLKQRQKSEVVDQ